MQIKLPESVLIAIKLLNEKGYEAFVVGGSIRNFLLGLPVDDYDLTTSATPEEMKEVFKNYKVIETGIKHGTLTIHINHVPLEITTYRIEKEYLDHRHPSKVEFTKNLEEDLARRDFTINALAYHPDLGIKDYFKGLDDLNNHLIKAINDPYVRFDEDALRIMRALRFASKLNFEIEEQTQKAIHESKNLLRYISKERIRDELIKFLLGENVLNVMMDYGDVLATIIPEIEPMLNCPHDNPHHIYDVYEHTAHVVEYIPAKKNLRLAALFHDIGKPYMKYVDENGYGRFRGHGEKSYELTAHILSDLKFSKNDSKAILQLIKYHDDYMKADKPILKHYLHHLGPELTYDLLELQIADNLAKDPKYLNTENYEKCRQLLDEIIVNKEAYEVSMLAINGHDLRQLGIPVMFISDYLNNCLEAVMTNKINNDYDSLINYLKQEF